MKAFKLLNSLKQIGLCLLIFLSGACEKIDVQTPEHLLSGDNIFTDYKTTEAAVLALYAKLRDNVLLTGSVKGLSNILGNYSDEIIYVSNYGLAEEPFYRNALDPNNDSVAEIWDNSYNIIYGSNSILEGIEKNTAYLTSEQKEKFSGEVLFVRALTHFYLVNLFGSIPYVTSTDYQLNKVIEKKDPEQIFQKIQNDLTMAIELLPELDESGINLRPTKKVAQTLLTRICLYTNQWTLAESIATEVIQNNLWEEDISKVFKNSSLSTIWQFSQGLPGYPTQEAETFIIKYAPPSERMLNPDLVQSFEEDDQRKTYWVGEIFDDSDIYYYPNKYKIGRGENNMEEFSVVFRMAELFLIRAEARARLNNLSGAAEDLNKIRNRAGLQNIAVNSQEEMIAAILQERRVELFTEHGNRFFDLKRTDNLDNTLHYKPGWNHTDRLFPLPEKELLLNPNLLPQNPGY